MKKERSSAHQRPSVVAFDLYSRAKSLLLAADLSMTGMTGDPDLRKAIKLLDEAVKRDSSFFDAYCQLAYAHEQLYAVTGVDHTPARLALAGAAVQAATRLRPDAAETHLARAGYLYFGLRDYAGALAELEIARRGLPNDPRLFEWTGYILRRRGQQEEGLRSLERAVELDPRNFSNLQQLAHSYQQLGRYAEAIAALDRVVTIVPRTPKRGPFMDNFTSAGKRTLGRCTRQSMQSSRKDRKPSPAPRTSGSFVLWPNAIRVRPNEPSSRWETINPGPKG